MTNPIATIGAFALMVKEHAVGITLLLAQVFYWLIIGPFKGKFVSRKALFEQTVFSGIRSIIIAFFVAFFTGIVLAMQSAYQLEQLGATMYVASLVAVSMTRELGPVLTALVVAGRVGAAITAELGSMKVTEQIEALEVLAINPIRHLVLPRILALLIMLPCLTIFADLVGMFGGWMIGVFNLKLSSGMYIDKSIEFLELRDIYTGLIKSFVFGGIIATIASYMGLSTKGGAEGVGNSTTVSVVSSFILIILADCVLTGIFYFSNM